MLYCFIRPVGDIVRAIVQIKNQESLKHDPDCTSIIELGAF